MSKVKIQGNASGTGTLTISAPNTNTDRTLTLPDGAGEILTDASTLSSSNLSGALPAIDGSALTGLSSGNSTAIYTYFRNNNTEGGTNTAGAWTTYPFNTEYSDPDGIGTLSSSQITLGAGKYLITFSIDMYKWNEEVVVLYNVSDSTEIGRGNNGRAGSGDTSANQSVGFGYLDCSTSKTISVRYYCNRSESTFGYGVPAGIGYTECYGILTVIKVG